MTHQSEHLKKAQQPEHDEQRYRETMRFVANGAAAFWTVVLLLGNIAVLGNHVSTYVLSVVELSTFVVLFRAVGALYARDQRQ